ncbi:MAG: NAD-dependent epimerase/dehydratase family protein [Brumimicrobium sp.]|nr:NAD-dependent epimerase/dehydratase family protein [Brumimicrobium sp.]
MRFVTGGTGLIGSHLLIELAQQDEPITAIYTRQHKIAQVKKLFEYYLQEEAEACFNRITWKVCDILDVSSLEEVMQGHTEVYHSAGFVSFARKDTGKLIDINRYGTANLVNLALSLGIKKFGFVSSTAAVGKKDVVEGIEITEETKWVKSSEIETYALSKYMAEKEVWRGINEGLNAVMVNPGVVIGAGDWKESSLAIFETVSKGLSYYPPGGTGYVDARDVARSLTQLMNKNIFGERYICVGVNAGFKELMDTIATQVGKKPPHKEITPFLMKIAYVFASIYSGITFSAPKLTKTVLKSSFTKTKFSNQKLKDAIGYEFYTLKESVENAVKGKLV